MRTSELLSRLVMLESRIDNALKFGFKSGVLKSGLEYAIHTPVRPGVTARFPKTIATRHPATGAAAVVTKKAPRSAYVQQISTPDRLHGSTQSAAGLKSGVLPLFRNLKKNRVTVSYTATPLSQNPKAVKDAGVLDQHYRRIAKRIGYKPRGPGADGLSRLIP